MIIETETYKFDTDDIYGINDATEYPYFNEGYFANDYEGIEEEIKNNKIYILTGVTNGTTPYLTDEFSSKMYLPDACVEHKS